MLIGSINSFLDRLLLWIPSQLNRGECFDYWSPLYCGLASHCKNDHRRTRAHDLRHLSLLARHYAKAAFDTRVEI